MTAGSPGRNPAVQAELDRLTAQYPGRDFWHVPVYAGSDGWCTKPSGAAISDIVRSTPQELREALEAPRDPAP